MTSDPFTLPRPSLAPLAYERIERLGTITERIEKLEKQGRNLQSLLGVGDPTMPADRDLPEFADLNRWSNLSGELFEEYRAGAKRRTIEAAQMYSDYVRVRDEVADVVVQVRKARAELRWIRQELPRWISSLTLADLDDDARWDFAIYFLDQQILWVDDLQTALIEEVHEIAAAIDWVETVSRNRTPLTEEQARAKHENNLRAIRHLGTADTGTGREQVPAGAFGVAAQALIGGHSVAFGRKDVDARVLRESLADNIKELAGSGAKFLQLDLPKVNQKALNDFLDSDGSVTDQETFFDQLLRNGTPSFGEKADGALVELIRAAHREGLDVVAGAPMIAPEHPLDRRATAVPYLAGMHKLSVETHGGPGIIVTNPDYTNVIDGLEKHIAGLVSIDVRADLPPGVTLITPWSGKYAPYSNYDSDLRSDDARFQQIIDSNENSTVVFNPPTK